MATSINTDIYGSLDEANDYFASRLHSDAWDDAMPDDRSKALLMARRLIDNLSFKGDKHTVWTYKQEVPTPVWNDPPGEEAYRAGIRAAEASQSLEFPRGADTTVPEPIRLAEYELAYSLLDGIDPALERENLAVTTQGYAEVRTHWDRAMVPIEHLINLIPNPMAWSLLKPFLRDDQALRMSRVS